MPNSLITFPTSFLGLSPIVEQTAVQEFFQTLVFLSSYDDRADYETEASFDQAIYGFSELADEYCLSTPFWIATCLKFLSVGKYQAAQIAIDEAKEIILKPGFEEALEIYGEAIHNLTSCVYLVRGEGGVLLTQTDC